jgi:hypothetical protein
MTIEYLTLALVAARNRNFKKLDLGRREEPEPLALRKSLPCRHRFLLSDHNPRPLTTLAQQHVELGAAYCDGATIRQRHCSARGIDRHDQIALRD